MDLATGIKYNATRDGFKKADFHSKCDEVKNTLTVITATSRNVFEGFAEQPWVSSCEGHFTPVSDPNSFIFSLVNKANNPFKAVCSVCGKNALRCASSFVPSFGCDVF